MADTAAHRTGAGGCDEDTVVYALYRTSVQRRIFVLRGFRDLFKKVAASDDPDCDEVLSESRGHGTVVLQLSSGLWSYVEEGDKYYILDSMESACGNDIPDDREASEADIRSLERELTELAPTAYLRLMSCAEKAKGEDHVFLMELFQAGRGD